MKNMEKKVVALVLALVMVCSMIVTALAEEVATVTDLLPVDETTVASDPVNETVNEVTDNVTTDEPAEEPAPEETEEPAEEIAPEATEEPGFVFTGRVGVRMLNNGDVYLGDTVVLLAVVVDANAKYTISWEVCKDGLNWEVLEENADHYSFVVNEVNAVYSYRAVLNVAE